MWEVYIHFILILLPLALWLIRFKKLNAELKLLGTTICITFFIEGYAAYLMFQLTRNLFLYHWLIPVQYVLFSSVFFVALTNETHKKVILLSIPLYLLLVILFTFTLQPPTEFNSYARLLKNILITGWTLLYYKEIFTSLKVVNLNKEPMFWVSTGLLFFSLGNFFVDGLMNYLLSLSYELAHTLNYIRVFLGYLLYITFLIALLLSKKQAQEHNYKKIRL